MELGQRLRQARLEAGLSQRQLCGQEITRNMLSQIENGSARPSMDTLKYLADSLGKPVSYFLDEQTVLSPNQNCMAQARTAPPEQALALLKNYQSPDPVFDNERYLLEALACLALAQTALADNRPGYAATLLAQAADAGSQSVYYTPALERQRLIACHRARAGAAQALAGKLPDNSDELALRADAALEAGHPEKAGQLLDCAEMRDSQWYLRRGECFLAQKAYAQAAACYLQAPQTAAVYSRLELCYRELEDYKQAYHYALKQREGLF